MYKLISIRLSKSDKKMINELEQAGHKVPHTLLWRGGLTSMHKMLKKNCDCGSECCDICGACRDICGDCK